MDVEDVFFGVGLGGDAEAEGRGGDGGDAVDAFPAAGKAEEIEGGLDAGEVELAGEIDAVIGDLNGGFAMERAGEVGIDLDADVTQAGGSFPVVGARGEGDAMFGGVSGVCAMQAGG